MKKVALISILMLWVVAGFAQNADAISGIWWNDKKNNQDKD